jgi:hypothetical protein
VGEGPWGAKGAMRGWEWSERDDERDLYNGSSQFWPATTVIYRDKRSSPLSLSAAGVCMWSFRHEGPFSSAEWAARRGHQRAAKLLLRQAQRLRGGAIHDDS